MVRDEILAFCRLGTLPSESDESEGVEERLAEVERLLLLLPRPVSDEEAKMLLESFGTDGCYGMAWTLLHVIETAPMPVVDEAPPPDANPWKKLLWRRFQNTLQGS